MEPSLLDRSSQESLSGAHLQCGEELDARVALAFGNPARKPPLPYSSDLVLAWSIADQFSGVTLEKTLIGWNCLVRGDTFLEAQGHGETAPLAICRAAVEAVVMKNQYHTPHYRPKLPGWGGRGPGYATDDDGFSDFVAGLLIRIERHGEDECWPWLGAKDAHGYGIVKFRGRSMRATRVMYMLVHKVSVAGLVLAHRCDNPTCVNPRHLVATTTAENIRDYHHKRRQRLASDRKTI